jgi:hypothetical protein
MDDKLKELEQKDTINQVKPTIVVDEVKDALGYFKVNVSNLPSEGLFYPDDVYIGVKPASVAEIRHWSMIDETDEYSFIQAIDFVLNQCVIIKSKTILLSISDICEVDRLQLIFEIREKTFLEGSNDVYVDVPYKYKGEDYIDKAKVSKDNLTYFKINEKLRKFYDERKRCFFIKGDNDFEVRLPSIGISQWVQDYTQKKIRANKTVDEFFIKMASFIIEDYKSLDDKTFFDLEIDSKTWSIKDISVLDIVTKRLQEGAQEGFKHKTKHGGIEVVVPLNFRGGVKSIFIIQDALGELD